MDRVDILPDIDYVYNLVVGGCWHFYRSVKSLLPFFACILISLMSICMWAGGRFLFLSIWISFLPLINLLLLFPGFGDSLNCEEASQAISDYIDVQFKKYFQDESGLHRKSIVDNRVHCCLYFIPPYGHG